MKNIAAKFDAIVLNSSENNEIIQKARQSYAVPMSQLAAMKIHSTMMPGASSKELSSRGLNKNEYMSASKALYDKKVETTSHKVKTKVVSIARNLKKQAPVAVMTLPILLIPGGEIIRNKAKAFSVEVKAARKARKNTGFISMVADTPETLRRQAKWEAKDIAELGPALQSNLHKLKHATQMLDIRQSELKRTVEEASQLDSPSSSLNNALFSKIDGQRRGVAMSHHEVLHYIDKVQSMNMAMQTTVSHLSAHLACLETLIEDSGEVMESSFYDRDYNDYY